MPHPNMTNAPMMITAIPIVARAAASSGGSERTECGWMMPIPPNMTMRKPSTMPAQSTTQWRSSGESVGIACQARPSHQKRPSGETCGGRGGSALFLAEAHAPGSLTETLVVKPHQGARS